MDFDGCLVGRATTRVRPYVGVRLFGGGIYMDGQDGRDGWVCGCLAGCAPRLAGHPLRASLRLLVSASLREGDGLWFGFGGR